MSDQDLYSLVSKDSQSDILASLPEEPTKKHSSSSSSKSKHHNTAKKSSTKKTMKKEPSIWNKYSLKQVKGWDAKSTEEWMVHSHGGKLTPAEAKALLSKVPKGSPSTTPGKWLLTLGDAEKAAAAGVPKEKAGKFAKGVEKLREKAATVTVQRLGRVVLGRLMMKKEKANVAHRSCVAHEILSTEEKYYEQLSIMIDLFYKPLQDKDILSQQEIREIFSDLEIIKSLSESFLIPLRERVKDWEDRQKLGDVFLKIIDYLKVYSEYVKGYSNAAAMVSKFGKSHPFTKFYQEQLTKAPESYAFFQFTSFLILPVQRIPRYKLLLADLLKHTYETHPDYADICEAHKKISDIATWVNENQRASEKQSKIKYYQESMVGMEGGLIESSRKFILDQEVLEIDGKKLKKRVLILFNDILIFCEPKSEGSLFSTKKTAKYTFCTKFRLERIKVTDITGTLLSADNILEIAENDILVTFSLPSADVKASFIDTLKKAVKDRKKLLKEQDEKIEKVAAPKAAAAAAILSSQYAAIKEVNEGTAPIKRRRDSVFGTGTYGKTVRKMTFYNMSPEEKWKVADEAKDELRKLSMRRASEISRREVEEEMKRDSKDSKSSSANGVSSTSGKTTKSRSSKCDSAPIKLKQIQTNMDGSLSLVQRGTPLKHELSGSGDSGSSASSDHEKFVPKQMAQRYGSKKTLESKPASSLASSQTLTEDSAGSNELSNSKFVPKQMAQRYGSKKTLESKPASSLTSSQTLTEDSAGSNELSNSKFVPKQMAQRYGTKKKQ